MSDDPRRPKDPTLIDPGVDGEKQGGVRTTPAPVNPSGAAPAGPGGMTGEGDPESGRSAEADRPGGMGGEG
jgi:hypothetical protein